MLKGIGCDLVRVERIDPYLEELEDRILSQTDRIRIREASRPRRLEFTAGRFALKEALVKAYRGTRTMSSFHVESGSQGEPVVINEQDSIQCSISHDGGLAMAFATVEGQ